MIFNKFNLIFLITFNLILLPLFIHSACPNKCSGHGQCIVDDICACKQNWFGGDCSLRKCPYTRAWVDSNTNIDPHYYVECANKGSCDRETGICNCDPGYGGSGCRRQTCPNDCSGHGTCEFIEDFTSTSVGLWDEHKIMGCKCDPGFEGHDCSSKICPKGDDPLTTDDSLYKLHIKITLLTGTYIYLIYSDPYGNNWSTGAIDTGGTTMSATCALIEEELLKIPNHALDGITVEANELEFSGYYDNVGGNQISYENNKACIVTFPNKPGSSGLQRLSCIYDENEMKVAGMQPFAEATDSLTECTVEQVFELNDSPILHELATCSNRGLCDGSTGQCECFTGHKGLACEYQEALY